MKWFQIEMFNTVTKMAMVAIVKAKEYGAACTKLAQIHGEAQFKLLGMYEPSQLDTTILVRVT